MLIIKDSEIVALFVDYLNISLNLNIKIDSIPERFNPGDIDALAGQYAIEHTSIDTIKNQRRDGDWFTQNIKGLEAYFKDKMDYRLTIYIEYTGIKKGQNWNENNKLLKNWIENKSRNLEYGKNMTVEIDGLDFKLKVFKTHKTELGIGVVFARILSDDFDPLNEIPNRLRRLIKTKLRKLGKYNDFTRLLLLENSDVALMNTQMMTDIIHESLSGCLPNEIDELWYADSSRYPTIDFHKVSFE